MKLDNIRKNLACERASVMVGSGFSKNAEMDESVFMRDWNSLAKVFFEKLYSKKPSDKDLAFQTPMRLASLIATSFGRHELDKMIYESLPDDRVFPGDIHRKLLALGWRDVFTTNYDRLLERASSDVHKYYNIVTNKETLLYSDSPRIVKLHGSFPDIHPFIMSDEDYRTYPKKYPEFVNTIRQSLIESILCLIGFSGNDPNFLAWIGWLRDIMENLSHPIYLITYDSDFHSSEYALLLKRNIDTINLAEIEGCNSYQDAISFFLSYLNEDEKQSWPFEEFDYTLNSIEDVKLSILKASALRKSYPEWLFMPKAKYDNFNDCTSVFPFIENKYNEIEYDYLRLELLYEIDWRLSVSLTPKNIEWFIKAVEQLEYTKEDDEESRMKKHSLKISLLSIYRYQLKIDEYKALVSEIQTQSRTLSIRLTRLFMYEQGLFSLAVMDAEYTLDIISKWKTQKFDYIAAIWKSYLLIHIGKREDAKVLLGDTLDIIKRQLVLLNNNDSPLLRSCGSQIENVLEVLSLRFTKPQKVISNHESFFETLNSFTENLNKETLCTYFKIEYSFNIGKRTRHWSLPPSGLNRNYLNSFRGAHLFEVGGFPFGLSDLTIETEKIKLICQQLIPFQFYYVVNIILQSYNIKLLEEVLNREVLETLTREEIDFLYNIYMPKIKIYIDSDNTHLKDKAHMTTSLLCFMSVKASQKHILSLVEIMIQMYRNNSRFYKDSYLETIFNCLSVDSLNKITPSLYQTPIELSHFGRDIYFPNTKNISLKIPNNVVDIMLEGLKSKDCTIQDAAYYRIASAFDKLNKTNHKRIISAVINWRNEQPHILNKKYSYNLVPYDIKKDKVDLQGIITNLVDNIKRANYKYNGSSKVISDFQSCIHDFIPLSKYMEVLDIEAVLICITKFLVENEQFLKKDDSKNYFGGLRSISNNLMDVIECFLDAIPLKKINKSVLDNLATIIKSYGKYGFKWFSMLVSLDIYLNKYSVESDLENSLSTNQDEIYMDTLGALYKLLSIKENSNLLKKVFDYIIFSNSSYISSYIEFLRILVSEKKLLDGYKSDFLNLVEKLYLRRRDSSISINDRINLEFETLRLVQSLLNNKVISKDEPYVNNWMAINKSFKTFNDVRLK